LVLEKNEGTVRRIVNGTMISQPLLYANGSNISERGMLGIAVAKHKYNGHDDTVYVFLYYTEKLADYYSTGVRSLDNRLYRYELVNNKLINPKLLLDLPATPGPYHNGGKVLIGSDNNVYVVVGDVFGHKTKAQNFVNGTDSDGTSGILRVTQDGKPVEQDILGHKFPLNLYYAYGIRNIFGTDFDCVTGKLWDTENGPEYGDEINLVEPGFNSEWMTMQGIWKPILKPNGIFAGNAVLHRRELVDFGGRGKYRIPEFTWFQPHGFTALKFLNSDKLGKQYQHDMFVGDFHYENIYHFKLNQTRTGLSLGSLSATGVANDTDALQRLIFGHNFGGITDIEVGPDGYLYVLSLYEGGNDCDPIHINGQCMSYSSSLQGTIFRIVPANLVN
jgi:aldose sugar dehydrogenase